MEHQIICQEAGGAIRGVDETGTGPMQGIVNEPEKSQQISPIVSVMGISGGTHTNPASSAPGTGEVLGCGDGHNGPNTDSSAGCADHGKSNISPSVKQLMRVISNIDINSDGQSEQQAKVIKSVSPGSNAGQQQTVHTTPAAVVSPATQTTTPATTTPQTTSPNTVHKKDRTGRPGDGQSCTS